MTPQERESLSRLLAFVDRERAALPPDSVVSAAYGEVARALTGGALEGALLRAVPQAPPGR